ERRSAHGRALQEPTTTDGDFVLHNSSFTSEECCSCPPGADSCPPGPTHGSAPTCCRIFFARAITRRGGPECPPPRTDAGVGPARWIERSAIAAKLTHRKARPVYSTHVRCARGLCRPARYNRRR